MLEEFLSFGSGAKFIAYARETCCSKIRYENRFFSCSVSMLFAKYRGDEAKINIEDHFTVGSFVHIYVANHKYDSSEHKIIYQNHHPSHQVLIKIYALIGAGVIRLPSLSIGENSSIATVLFDINDFPAYTVASVNPALPINKII